ncbi:MAG: hypothetical protein WKF55_11915 [Gemmatimonadaceae bacterium]
MRYLYRLLLIPLFGCSFPSAKPPEAEFLVADGSSTYWVRSGPRGITARMSPLILTSANDRFYEVYVGESARSYDNAVFTTEPVFRRDVVTGDSTLLLADPGVSNWEKRYLSMFPGAALLDSDELNDDDVDFAASSEIDILGVVGPYILYDRRTTVERGDDVKTDALRGALDVRSGDAVPLAAVGRDSTVANGGGIRDANGVTWRHAGYEVVARLDTARAETEVVLRNLSGREWILGYVDSGLPRVFWLDEHRAGSKLRIALTAAFDGALIEGGDTQIAQALTGATAARYATTQR